MTISLVCLIIQISRCPSHQGTGRGRARYCRGYRSFKLKLAAYEQQRGAIGNLRKEATSGLSEELYQELCIKMGKSPAIVLSAKELVQGLPRSMLKSNTPRQRK